MNKNTKTTYMAQIRSKQIADFLASVNWATVSNTDIANAADIDARFSIVEAAQTADFDSIDTRATNLEASVDSLESALSTDVYSVGLRSTNLEASVDSLESALSTDVYSVGVRSTNLETRATNVETRATNLEASVDSLESALSTEKYETNQDVIGINNSIDSIESALSTDVYSVGVRSTNLETRATNLETSVAAILSGADVDLDQFVEVVSFIEAIDLTNDNVLAEYVIATDNSIDSLESALSTEKYETNQDVIGINNSIDSLESALSTDVYSMGVRATNLEASVDSLESALSTDIYSMGERAGDLEGDVTSINTRVANEEAARLAGDKMAEVVMLGGAVVSNQINATTWDLQVSAGTSFRGGIYDLEVYINGLRVEFTHTPGTADFSITTAYDIEPTDRVVILGVQL